MIPLVSFLVNENNIVKGQVCRLWEKLRPAHEGVPMIFDPTDNDGWGVCTLRGKKKLGKTSFVQYDFDLPRSDYVLPLKLGQQVSLCCLDETGNVAKGNFYSYSSGAGNQKFGCFSILAPEKTPEDTQFSIGSDSAHFVSQQIGDENCVMSSLCGLPMVMTQSLFHIYSCLFLYVCM